VWDKYQLASLTGDKFKTNTLIEQPKLTSNDPANFEDPEGVFSAADNAIPTLMRRGVVFLACHNAIAELADRLIKKNANPDKLSFEQLTAELTNHLIPEVVLTPGVVATLPLLQQAGFHYAK
jgi:argininosuccinate lyase